MKQVILLRKDLKLGKGKLVSQGAHASVLGLLEADSSAVKLWTTQGMPKIVLGVQNETELLEYNTMAAMANLPVGLVKDAAKTQLKVPTYTAIGIGPADDKAIDALTRGLKLL